MHMTKMTAKFRKNSPSEMKPFSRYFSRSNNIGEPT
jgi:hypothetical protein